VLRRSAKNFRANAADVPDPPRNGEIQQSAFFAPRQIAQIHGHIRGYTLEKEKSTTVSAAVRQRFRICRAVARSPEIRSDPRPWREIRNKTKSKRKFISGICKAFRGSAAHRPEGTNDRRDLQKIFKT
jgi:hypothetical protein